MLFRRLFAPILLYENIYQKLILRIKLISILKSVKHTAKCEIIDLIYVDLTLKMPKIKGHFNRCVMTNAGLIITRNLRHFTSAIL